ncbi:MAG: DUF4342 domain-containing protein [Desulfitobacteriaceae bacterium]|nr:DUF4342 domain-containing protein [Desulfitobacteriaceae bacterium]MDI6878606.1 DUF4342 domain-containing protein [Desulfitobacteriaceae bacterium]MDI6914875.1 DUF4342 domain-containing protein [Desulfitobacteriaceae bacterium]
MSEGMSEGIIEGPWTELEKVDILRERMGLNYEEARKALEKAQGDLVKALADVEKGQSDLSDGFKERGQVMWEGMQEKWQRLNQTRVNLKREDRTLLSVSAPAGLAIAYTILRRPGLRMLGLMGIAAAALRHYTFEVESFETFPPTNLEDAYDEAELGE